MPIISPNIALKKAIRDKLPNAPFAGPDVIVHADWLEKFAATEAADIKLLTHHYYAEGPPDNPTSTIETLLKPNAILPGLLGRAASRFAIRAAFPIESAKPIPVLAAASRASATPWRRAFGAWISCLRWRNSTPRGVNMETGVNHLGFLSYYTPIE